jgi:hypothetical protein
MESGDDREIEGTFSMNKDIFMSVHKAGSSLVFLPMLLLDDE